MWRPCTHWRCSCGAKLIYRNRFISKAGILTRYYVCSNVDCVLMYKSEEKLIGFLQRDIINRTRKVEWKKLHELG